jgi:N-methylhydantoinase B
LAVDLITLEVVRNGLSRMAEEMEAILLKTARSGCIKDAEDASCAIFDGEGRTIAEAAAIAIHLGSMEVALRSILANSIPPKEWHDGDVVIMNDPYSGGTHLPDISLFKPVVSDGKPFAFCGTLGHQVDVGGIAPGGTSPLGAEIYQEGLRLPPIKLYERGKLNKSVEQIIKTNVRAAETVWADLQAMMFANEAGARSVRSMCKKYSNRVAQEYMEELIKYSEKRMRKEIASWKDGVIEREVRLDDDGRHLDKPVMIKATIHKKGDEITVDFTGTDRQVEGPINCMPGTAISCVNFAVVAMASPDIPHNHGCSRPIKVILPEGSLLNPYPPAPCALRHLAAFRLGDAIVSALGEIVTGKGIAESDGPLLAFNISGISPKTGRYFSELSLFGGGGGARNTKDGLNAVSHNLTNSMCAPTEVLEMELPIMCDRFSMIPDSGGAGRFRGGLAVRRELRMLTDGITFVWRVERSKNPAQGLLGGGLGRPSRIAIRNSSGEEKPLPHTGVLYKLKKGDTMILESPGGGGYGDPKKRDPRFIQEDFENGLITKWDA